MKCSDFSAQYDAIRDAELNELYEAVKAHGGSYVFESELMPAVQVWDGSYYNVTEATVTWDFGIILQVYGERTGVEEPELEDITEAIQYGYISRITKAIPATEKVHSVTSSL